jgi:hypothetical protein
MAIRAHDSAKWKSLQNPIKNNAIFIRDLEKIMKFQIWKYNKSRWSPYN